MSIADLNQTAYTLGVANPDNWKSKVYNGSTSATVTTKSGNGMTNNRPFVTMVHLVDYPLIILQLLRNFPLVLMILLVIVWVVMLILLQIKMDFLELVEVLQLLLLI